MTVAELIERLQGLDPDLTVVVDTDADVLFAEEPYEGTPEIGYRYAIIAAGRPIPEGMNPNEAL